MSSTQSDHIYSSMIGDIPRFKLRERKEKKEIKKERTWKDILHETIRVIWIILLLFWSDLQTFIFKKKNFYFEFFGEPFFDQEQIFTKIDYLNNKKQKKTLKSKNNVLVVFCHPENNTSLCAQIFKKVISTLDKIKISSSSLKIQFDYDVIDLYESGFDPLLKKKELYEKKNSRVNYTKLDDEDRDIGNKELGLCEAQKMIKRAKYLIFIYPIWWNNMPSLLKGFCERTMSPGFAYHIHPNNEILDPILTFFSYIPFIRGILQNYSSVGLLRGKQSLIFRTLGGPSSGPSIFGNTIKGLENSILRFCGLLESKVYELANLDNCVSTQSQIDSFLNSIEYEILNTIIPEI